MGTVAVVWKQLTTETQQPKHNYTVVYSERCLVRHGLVTF